MIFIHLQCFSLISGNSRHLPLLANNQIVDLNKLEMKKLEKSQILFGSALFVGLSVTLIGFFALADIIQWLIIFPNEFTYWAFNSRFVLMGLGALAMIIAFVINFRKKIIAHWGLLMITLIFSFMSMAGYLMPPYIMFRSEHKTAEYIEHAEVNENYLLDSDEVIVIINNDDARAFPNKWIVQTHIAGDNIGGDDIVMTYCGLSHLGQAYQSDLEGADMNLKVLTQLENNLVLFDENSQEIIPQMFGTTCKSEKSLNNVPSMVMSYGSYKKLYPEGRVYHFEPESFVEKQVYKMLHGAIYAEGGQYDMSTEDLAFASIKHNDDRLHPKQQVYGISINEESVAVTKEHLQKNGNSIVVSLGGEDVTIKYFEEYDFVNVFYGNILDVDHYGRIGDEQYESVPHYNQVLWKVWTNFYRDTDLKS